MRTLRRFRIQSHGYEFQTGILSDGTQVLLVPTSATQFACVKFDTSGILVSSEELTSAITETEGIVTVTAGPVQLQAKKTPIEIQSFVVPAVGLGIRPRPESFEEFLRDPVAAEPDARYRQTTAQQIREWDENNCFVLSTWGKEYWMNGDGSVFAT